MLLRPWDFPGKSNGVGCHFLLQCMKVKSESEVVQPCPTLRDPMDCSPPGSSVHGIFQVRVMEWGAIAFSKRVSMEINFRFCVYVNLLQSYAYLVIIPWPLCISLKYLVVVVVAYFTCSFFCFARRIFP